MPDSERFTTRAYRHGDEAQILDLFARSFHLPRSREHFEWKYRRNPFGNERISVTFDGDRLAGHYAGYCVPFRDGGRDLLAYQIGDTMTDVSIRNVGRGPTSILGRTAQHFYETFCAGTVAFNYGFNVANIQRFSVRFLRSDVVEPVTYRARPPLPRISRFSRWPRGYQLEIVSEVGVEFDRFFARVAPSYGFLVRRDAAYLRWRYFECPDVPYVMIAIRKWRRLVGWIVFRLRDNRFSWGDALFDPRHEDAVEVLLRHVVPSYPVDLIECWFPPRPAWFDRVLLRLGFETRPEPQDLALMCVPWELPEATEAMRARLYYAMGDSDLF